MVPLIGGKGSSSLLLLFMNLDDPCCLRIFFDLITCRCVNGSMVRFPAAAAADAGERWSFGESEFW